ncbi:MAG TPA: hypothetical protein VFY83_10720, partial [Anaerolineales bacterium]|nr:hypothetical protein [Anaerolineales bacterium]
TRAETANRHPGHGDQDVLEELYTNLANTSSQVLDISGSVIEVDTTDFSKVDYQGILKQVMKLLSK